MTRTVECGSCEHGHAIGSICTFPTRGTGSGVSATCGCTTGAASVITVRRASLVPVSGFGGQVKWSYSYVVDDGPLCQYGSGLRGLREVLRHHHPKAKIVETWKV